MKKGFTLVEMMVVMAIVAIVGIILVMIFANTLRGSSKAQILSVIKQNGQAVLGVMDNAIRNADNVACISTSGDTLAVVKNGIYTRFRFKNDYIEKENLLDFTTTTCSDLSVSPVILTNTDPKTGVSVTGGLFTRGQSSGFKDTITVSFELNGGEQAPEVISGQIDAVKFQTTIQLR